MFNRKPTPKTVLDEVIDDVLQSLKGLDIEDENYTETVENVDKLMKLKQNEKPERVSKDTLAVVGANLLGIVMILEYEHARVISSKAISFVQKLR